MAFFPISHTVSQYVDTSGDPYSGAVLKAYSSGTLNTVSMATDATGGTLAATITLNSDGYPSVSGTIVIPYIEEKYKLALYPTQAAADSDTGAIWTVDGVPISGDFLSATQTISTTTALDSSDNGNHIEMSGTITVTLPDIGVVGSGFVGTGRNAGSGVVTIDGDGAETINGDSSIYLYPGDFIMWISGSTNWSAEISRKKRISIYSGFHATANEDEIPLNGDSIAMTSGGSVNGAQYANVYAYLWDNLADGQAAVAGGRGASATADFTANKTITAPDYRDFTLVGVSAGGSITTVGDTAGASTVASTGSIGTSGSHTLTTSEIPSHSHGSGWGAVNTTGDDAYMNGSRSNTGSPTRSVTTEGGTPISQAETTSDGGGSGHTHTGGTYTGSASSVLQKSAGVYWYVNF